MLTGLINGKLSQWVGLMRHPEGPQSQLLSGQLDVKLTQRSTVTPHEGRRIKPMGSVHTISGFIHSWMCDMKIKHRIEYVLSFIFDSPFLNISFIIICL